MSPKGTPKIGAPRSLHEIEQDRIEADIEQREQALDDAALSKPLDLTPEEKASLEREKAELAEQLRSTRPARPGREVSAPISLSSHHVVDISEVAPEREVEVVEPSRLDAVEQAEEELLALAQDEAASLDEELRAYEEKSAIEMARIREAGEQKRAEIRKRQEVARLKIERERAAAVPAELAARAKTATQAAAANRTRKDSTLDTQRALLAEEWAPLLTAAKSAVRDVAQIEKQAGPALRELASMAAFIDTPSNWPVELRTKMGKDCILPARELVRLLDSYQRTDNDAPRDIIAQVERMLQTWRPGTMVANLRQALSYVNADMPRYLREQIAEINRRFSIIEQQGLEYIATGAVPPEAIISEATEKIRREGKEALIYGGMKDPRQTQAAGMGEPLPN
jgi:hypothetical protein